MTRHGVPVFVRRGEHTIEGSFDDGEPVAQFKRRMFATELTAGRQCRLIWRGRELSDTSTMVEHRIGEGMCLHAVIGPVVARGAQHQASPDSAREGRGAHVGLVVLCAMTTAMVGSFCTLAFLRPDLYRVHSLALLAFITVLQLRFMQGVLQAGGGQTAGAMGALALNNCRHSAMTALEAIVGARAGRLRPQSRQDGSGQQGHGGGAARPHAE